MAIPFNVIAVRDSSVVEVDPERLLTLLHTAPDLALRWMTSLAHRLMASHRHALVLLRKDLPAQVAAVLLLEQEQTPGGPPEVRLSQEAIAQLLGASRQSVSRVLGELRARGLVRTGYRTVVLLDPEGWPGWPTNPIGTIRPRIVCSPAHTYERATRTLNALMESEGRDEPTVL